MKAVFISTEVLKLQPGFIQRNVEDSVLAAVIYRAQNLFIKPLIGRKLYERLMDGIYNDFNGLPGGLTIAEKKLLNEYIMDCLICACEIKAVIHTTLEIRNKGTGKTRDEYLDPADHSDSKFLRDELRKDFDSFKLELISYLRDNYTLYPQFYAYGEPGHCYCTESNARKAQPKVNFNFNI